MKKISMMVALVATFVAGMVCSRFTERAAADTPAVLPMAIDLSALTPSALPSPNAALPGVRTMPLATVGDAQFAFQTIADAPKHTHASSTEVQLVLSGTGTEWLGDKQIPISPGTFILVPPNTAHGGFTGGPFKLYTVKTPPQMPGDYHPVT